MKHFESFDDVYKTTEWYYGAKPFKELPDTLQRFKFPTNSTALDLGCGEGRDSIFLSLHGFNVTAIDISENGLLKLSNFAKEKNLNIECVCANAVDYNYQENSYDIIVARTFLDHLALPEINIMIEKMRKALRTFGIIFISVFTTQDVGYLKSQECGYANEQESECASFIKHYFEENELKKFFLDWNILTYYERTKIDTSHGTPHQHGVAHIVAQKSDFFI